MILVKLQLQFSQRFGLLVFFHLVGALHLLHRMFIASLFKCYHLKVYCKFI